MLWSSSVGQSGNELIVYSATKHDFLKDNNDREIDDVIRVSFTRATGHRVSENEQRSWRESLSYMAKVITDDAIPADAGIAVEYHIPLSAKRLDMLIAGHAADDRRSAVIVELKQWDQVQLTPKDAIVRTYVGGGVREAVHPSYQAWSYAEQTKSFNAAVYKGDIGSGRLTSLLWDWQMAPARWRRLHRRGNTIANRSQSEVLDCTGSSANRREQK